MAFKRINLKVCRVMYRKFCTHGEAEFAEPKFPTVKQFAHRSILEAMTPQYVQLERLHETALCGEYPITNGGRK